MRFPFASIPPLSIVMAPAPLVRVVVLLRAVVVAVARYFGQLKLLQYAQRSKSGEQIGVMGGNELILLYDGAFVRSEGLQRLAGAERLHLVMMM
jgi:hypothetical protein